jgi:hypothetical protein
MVRRRRFALRRGDTQFSQGQVLAGNMPHEGFHTLHLDHAKHSQQVPGESMTKVCRQVHCERKTR